MEPARYNLRIVRGDDFLAQYRFTVENGETAVRTPIDLTGWGIESKITGMRDLADLTITATIEDAQDGIVQLFIPDSVTITLPKRNADWYLKLISPDLIGNSYMAGDAFFLTPGGSL